MLWMNQMLNEIISKGNLLKSDRLNHDLYAMVADQWEKPEFKSVHTYMMYGSKLV